MLRTRLRIAADLAARGPDTAMSGPVPTGPAKASFGQRWLWLLDRLTGDSPEYHVHQVMRLSGPVDPGVLRRALQDLVDRHEVLRTVFRDTGGDPEPIPRDTARIEVPVLEVRSAADVVPLARSLVRRPFDLGIDLPIRMWLLQLGGDEWALVLAMHHIATDGWSMRVIWQELAVCYRARLAGRPPELPPLRTTYREVTLARHTALTEATRTRQLDYWRQQLAGLTTLQLPTIDVRPPIRSGAGTEFTFPVPPTLVRRLHEAGRLHGVTLFTVGLAAFQAVLARWSGQYDIAVGTPVLDRHEIELEGVVGYLVNTVVLRGDLTGDPTPKELLRRTRDTAIDAYTNQELPFEQVVSRLQPRRDPSRTPLFQVMFTVDAEETAGFTLPGVEIAPVPVSNGTCQFDLSIGLTRAGDAVIGTVGYDTALFDDETAERLAAHLIRALGWLAGDPDLPLSELDLWTDRERALVEAANATARPLPAGSLPELIAAQADRYPDAIAVRAGADTMTYAELDRRANRLAELLLAEGAGPRAPVAVHVQRSPELLIALLGVLKTGAPYLPLEPTLPIQRRTLLRTDADADLVVTASGTEALGGHPVPLDSGTAEGRVTPIRPIHPDDLAYVIYTSGSTGRPKAVMVTHRGVVNLAVDLIDRWRLGPGVAVAALASFGFDMSVPELLVPLVAGATVVLVDRETTTDARRLAALIDQADVTVMQATPAGWELLLDGGWGGAPALRAVCGADAMPADLARRLRPKVGELWNIYGPTETTVWSTIQADVAATGGTVPIGRPLANTHAHVLDESGRPVPIGAVGQLHLGGVGVTRGYLGAPGRTAERFVPDPQVPGARLYRTGDLARWRPDGCLEFLGRMDTQVKIRGYRIELGEVRAALLGHPAVAAAVAVVHGAGTDARLVGYVVPAGAAGSAERIRADLRALLPAYLVPPVIVEIDRIPLSANGKVDTSQLAAAVPARPSRGPETEAERRVHTVWAEVLGRTDFGVHDDFFALGGHSLAALGVINRLRARLRDDIDVHLVFRHPTVADLAGALAGTAVAAAEPRITRRPANVPAPLSSAQRRLWFLHRLRPDRLDYHVTTRNRLRGRLDPATLIAAVEYVLARHEVLWCRFVDEPDGPVQTPMPGRPRVEFTDLSRLTVDSAARRADEITRAAADAPFDVATGPLSRVCLVRTADEEHLLCFVLHHAIVDGWSITLLWREISAAYRSLHDGKPPEPTDRGLQYADYACWQRHQPALHRAADLEHWRERLAGKPVFELPTDRPRPPEWSGRGDIVEFEISSAKLARLDQLAAAAGGTRFMALLAVFHAVLAVHSGEPVTRVGTPVAGREITELESLVGCFVNTVVLTGDATGDPSLRTLLDRVRTDTVDGLAHQGLPFEDLVEELKPDRDPSRNPLFSALFSLDNDDTAAMELPGLEVDEVPFPTTSAKADLALSLVPNADGGLDGGLVYATDLFHRATAAGLVRTFTLLLAAFATDPDQRLSDVDLVGAAVRPRLLAPSRPAAHGARPAELLADVVGRAPGSVALRYGHEVYTHGELWTRAHRVAYGLLARGVGPEDVVAVALPRSPDLVIALMGVLLSGGTYLPLDVTQPTARTDLLLHDSGAQVVITDIEEFCGDDRPLPPMPRADALAAIFYTSGSAGRPKAVGLTHGGIGNYLRYLMSTIGLTEHDVALQLAPVSFDASLRDILGPLAAGGQVIIVPQESAKDPYALVAELERRRVTVLPSLVPAMLGALATAADPDRLDARRTLRLGLVSGEQLTATHVAAASRLHPRLRLVNQYGPTECTMTSTFHRVEPAEIAAGRIPIGEPIDGARCFVLGRHGELLPAGAFGELHLSSPGLARGYPGAPGLTAERFVPSPFGPPGARMFRTGDFGRWDSEHRLEFHGRRDDQVKIRGVRVELGEVDAVLSGCPGVSAAAARVLPGPAGSELVGYLAPGNADLDAVRRRLSAALPDQLVPSRYVVLQELPRTAHGKLDRARLPLPTPTDVGPVVVPRDPVELRMTRIWERVLGRDRIGIRDDFFALGGHSLLAVALVERIRAELGVAVPLHAVFRLPTPERLCEALPALSTDAAKLIIPLVEGPAEVPPLFLVHPQGGGVCCYLDLAHHISGRTVYGVEAVGQNTDEPPLTRIEDMAARYIEEIRAVRPTGPYLLAGWSFGGNVAFELAYRLERAGQRVGFLGILDARVFGRDALDEWYQAKPELERFGRAAGLPDDDLRTISTVDSEEAMSILLRDARTKDQVSPLADVTTMRRMVGVFTANGRAADRYRSAARVGVDIHLFRARDRHPTLTNPIVDPGGWAERTTGDVHTASFPGTHHDFLYPPHAEGLGDRLATILAGIR